MDAAPGSHSCRVGAASLTAARIRITNHCRRKIDAKRRDKHLFVYGLLSMRPHDSMRRKRGRLGRLPEGDSP